MQTLANQTTRIDVEHMGHREVIAACLLEGADGPAIVDPGPASTLPTLRRKLASRGIAIADLRALLLTHIHLDHAGATGTLVKENPHLQVYVHERGAPHLVDPGKLLDSARRLYGELMDTLWGEFLAVPQANLRVLRGGESIRAAGRVLDVEYTPGHASHHVSYFDGSTGTAFTGDTTGIRIEGRPCLVPPTPPPDIELEIWNRSLDVIAARKPARVFLTHFGPAAPVPEQIAELRETLARWAEMVRGTLGLEMDDAERAAKFTQDVIEEMKKKVPEEEALHYVEASSPILCWYGLARYWRKRK